MLEFQLLGIDPVTHYSNIHAWVPNTGNQLCYQQQMQYVNIGFILRSSAKFFWWLKSNNVWQVGCHSCLAFKGRWAYFLRYYYIGEIDWVNANQNRLGNVEASYWGCQKFCLAGLRNWGVHRTDWWSKSPQKSSLDVAEDAECSGDENLNCMHLPMKKWRELITKVMKPLWILLAMLPRSCTAHLHLKVY